MCREVKGGAGRESATRLGHKPLLLFSRGAFWDFRPKARLVNSNQKKWGFGKAGGVFF